MISEMAPQSLGYESATPQSEDYTVMAGGREFDISREAEMKKRSNDVVALFDKMLEGAPEKDAAVARQVAAMAPMAVSATGGDMEAATKMMLDFYTKTIPAKKKGKGGGGVVSGDVAGKPWAAGKRRLPGAKAQFSAYVRSKEQAMGQLRRNQFYDDNEAVENLKTARYKLLNGGSVDQREAVIMMAKALQKGRLSDKDVDMAEGYKSLTQEVLGWFSVKANKEAKLASNMLKPLVRAIDNSLRSKYVFIKGDYDILRRQRNSAEWLDEAKGYDSVMNSEFGGFDFAKEPPPKSGNILDEMEKKYGGQ
jgi:hypothetical protein